jgi:hypothetical protein
MPINLSGSLILTGSLTATSSINTPVVNSPLLQNGSQYIAQDTITGITAIVNGVKSWGFYPGGTLQPAGAIVGSTFDATSVDVTQNVLLLKSLYYGAQIVTAPDGVTTQTWNFKTDGNLELPTGKYITGSLLGTASYAANADLLDNRDSSTFANTGSNIFDGGQYFSNASNASNFNSTASLYSDGGMRITKDLYVSGTSYFNNVTVFGTQSVAYISSSQLNIGTNIISVNTDVPAIRFGGLAVYDSGSTGLTGSILWDSQANHWVYSNPSGSTYSGGMFISGPRSAALGSEQGTTACRLLVGQGGDHLTSSMIYHDSTVTCIPTAIIGGSTACFANTVCSPSFVGGTLSGTTGTFSSNAASLTIGSNDTSEKYLTVKFSNGDFYFGGTSVQNYIYGVGSRNLALWTNSTQRFVLDGNGVSCFACRVCVPQLIINANCIINPNNSGAEIWNGEIKFGGTMCIYQGQPNGAFSDRTDLVFVTNTGFGIGVSEKMRLTAGGSLGIGTASPYQNLQVYQTGTAGNNYVEGTVQVGGTSSTLGAALSYTAQNSGYVNLVNLNTSGGANARISLGFGAISSGLPASTVMTLNQSGNVGIGVSTTPVYMLEVSSTGGSQRIRVGTLQNNDNTPRFEAITSNGVSVANSAWLRVNDAGGFTLGQSDYAKAGGDSGNFSCLSSEVEIPRITVSSTGNTQFSLPNSGNSVSTGNITLLSTATAVNDRLTINFAQTGIISRARAGIGSVAEESGGYAASLAFYTRTALDGSALDTANERMRINSTGNVGIGTTSLSTEANLYLGAQGALEGGQLVLQRGTSCNCATHLDNYQNTFRIMSGTDTGSTTVNMSINHVNGIATFSSTICAPLITSAANSISITGTEFLTTLATDNALYIITAQPEAGSGTSAAALITSRTNQNPSVQTIVSSSSLSFITSGYNLCLCSNLGYGISARWGIIRLA